MAVIDYGALPEFPMRAGIMGKWLAGIEHGSSSVSVLTNTVEPDARVPLHHHVYEEVILVQEGRIQAELVHPNIVRVTDVVDLGGAVGLVMDFVEGVSLRELLQTEGKMPPPEFSRAEVAQILIDAARR